MSWRESGMVFWLLRNKSVSVILCIIEFTSEIAKYYENELWSININDEGINCLAKLNVIENSQYLYYASEI
jgi:hypothetical protein